MIDEPNSSKGRLPEPNKFGAMIRRLALYKPQESQSNLIKSTVSVMYHLQLTDLTKGIGDDFLIYLLSRRFDGALAISFVYWLIVD